jgi:hypothetical protein
VRFNWMVVAEWLTAAAPQETRPATPDLQNRWKSGSPDHPLKRLASKPDRSSCRNSRALRLQRLAHLTSDDFITADNGIAADMRANIPAEIILRVGGGSSPYR